MDFALHGYRGFEAGAVPGGVHLHAGSVTVRTEDPGIEYDIVRADLKLIVVPRVSGWTQESLHNLLLIQRIISFSVGAPDI